MAEGYLKGIIENDDFLKILVKLKENEQNDSEEINDLCVLFVIINEK